MMPRMLLVVTLAHGTVLDSERVAVGVAQDGSLCDLDAWVGVLHDADGPGGDPVGTDLLLPGRCFETWALSSSAGTDVQALGDTSGTVLAWDEPVWGEVQSLTGRGELTGAEVELTFDLPYDRAVVYMTTTVTATQDLTDVWLSRTVDADTDYLFTGTYDTANGAADEVAWAASALSDKAMALAAIGGEGGICSWCSTPEQVAAGTVGELEGDYVIGVAVPLGDLAEGDQVEVVMVYGFGQLAEAVASVALDAAAADDRDGDGVSREEDCDDRDARVAPGLGEVADGLDNDCDGDIDEDLDDTGVVGFGGWADETDDLAVTHVEEPPGGCSTVAVGPWVLGLLLLRRRR
ncbi:MAG: hypothetical protein GY884_21790 [Proteobacteria bacterium]|nr:hypothetical protein [Pseudomonadota bacterium]